MRRAYPGARILHPLSEARTMSEMIRKVDYYYTTTSDKPGEGTRLLTTLKQAGVEVDFTLSGGHIMPLYDGGIDV